MNDIVFGILISAGGILFYIYRHPIGELTGYYIDGKIVDKPTPGCLLVPFALAFITIGSILAIKGIVSIFLVLK